MPDNRFRSGFVCLAGRPNVGKSTLLNRLVGNKVAIVSDKPQTTRNRITGVYNGDAAQIVFIDTPGLHQPQHLLGQYMVRAARRALQEVDIVAHVVDATAEYGAGEEALLNHLREVRTPVFLVVNKIDLLTKEKLLVSLDSYAKRYDYTETIPVAAVSGENCDRLLEQLLKHLPEGPQYYPPGMVTDQPERFVIAEIVREKVFHLTREEIPHGVGVVVDSVEERNGGLVFVAAAIMLEKESHRGIIIGRGGQMLKEVGRLAREEIEKLWGNKVYLDLRVKVKKNWRRREALLRDLGYDDQ